MRSRLSSPISSVTAATFSIPSPFARELERFNYNCVHLCMRMPKASVSFQRFENFLNFKQFAKNFSHENFSLYGR